MRYCTRHCTMNAEKGETTRADEIILTFVTILAFKSDYTTTGIAAETIFTSSSILARIVRYAFVYIYKQKK